MNMEPNLQIDITHQTTGLAKDYAPIVQKEKQLADRFKTKDIFKKGIVNH